MRLAGLGETNVFRSSEQKTLCTRKQVFLGDFEKATPVLALRPSDWPFFLVLQSQSFACQVHDRAN